MMIETTLENKPEKTGMERRQLLPLWIKIFLWFFLILGCFVPLGLIASLFYVPFQLSVYGMTTTNPFSLSGLLIMLIMLYKGYTAFALWTGKKNAVLLAQIDAISGMLVCVIVMVMGPGIMLRLELIVLIPYLIKMTKIKSEWLS